MTEPIKFPKTFKKTESEDDDVIKTIEDVDNHMYVVKAYHIAETASFIAESIFHNLTLGGFDLEMENPKNHKNIAMLMESLKSLMMDYHDMEHPIQHIAETLFEVGDDGIMIMKVPKNDTV